VSDDGRVLSLFSEMTDTPALGDKKNLLKPKSPVNIRKKKSAGDATESKILQDTCRYECIIRFNHLGNPITLEDAIDLKTICWGSSKVKLGRGWLRGIKFNEPEETTAYGLKHDEDAPKSFLMVLQGIYLNQSLFSDGNYRNTGM